MNREQMCPLCETDSFRFYDGDTFRWMWVVCEECGLSIETRKADYQLDADENENRQKGIDSWRELTLAIRANIVAQRDAEWRAAINTGLSIARYGGENYGRIAADVLATLRQRMERK